MKDGPLVLELPEPPSANRWWRHVGSRVLVSRQARAYKQLVANRLTVMRVKKIPAPEPVSVSLVWYRGRRSGDLDKRLGVLLDALQGAVYQNDSQVVRILATREEAPRAPRIVVTVSRVVGALHNRSVVDE